MVSDTRTRAQRQPWPVWAAMAASVAIALLANLLLAVADRGRFTQTVEVPLAPPGYVIGSVWVVLFALMGAAYARLRRFAPRDRRMRQALLWLIALCALYPAYTDGLQSVWAGLVGVLVVLGLNTWILTRLWRAVRQAALLLVPLQVWLVFATYLIVAQLLVATK